MAQSSQAICTDIQGHGIRCVCSADQQGGHKPLMGTTGLWGAKLCAGGVSTSWARGQGTLPPELGRALIMVKVPSPLSSQCICVKEPIAKQGYSVMTFNSCNVNKYIQPKIRMGRELTVLVALVSYSNDNSNCHNNSNRRVNIEECPCYRYSLSVSLGMWGPSPPHLHLYWSWSPCP